MKTQLIIGVVVAALVGGGVLWVNGLRSKVARLTTENARLVGVVKTQSDAALEAKRENEKRDLEAQAALAKAKVETEQAKKRAKVIYKTVPSRPGDDCGSALDLLNGRGL